MGLTVVGNPAATEITSSPDFIALSPSLELVRQLKAIRLAEEPELTVIKCFTPMKLANFNSKSSLAGHKKAHDKENITDIHKMTMAQLKKECASKNIVITGKKKEDLVQLLADKIE